MEKKELAHKVLEGWKTIIVPCRVNCFSAEYSEIFNLYIGEGSARYLIKRNVVDPSVFDGLKLHECKLQSLIDHVVSENIDDDCEFEYECESESAYTYIKSFATFINLILDGTITEGNIEEWVSYFDDASNFEWDILDYFK